MTDNGSDTVEDAPRPPLLAGRGREHGVNAECVSFVSPSLSLMSFEVDCRSDNFPLNTVASQTPTLEPDVNEDFKFSWDHYR